MNRISVADAAKELAMNEEEFLRKLREMGISAEDSYSTFATDDFERVKNLLDREKTREPEAFTETRVRPNIIRRRRKPPPPPEPVVEEAALPPTPEESLEVGAPPVAEVPEGEEPVPVEIEGEIPAVERETDSEEIPITEPEAEGQPMQAKGVIEVIAEQDRPKLDKEIKIKKVKVKGVTKEPAKVLEKMDILPSDLFKPAPEEPPGPESRLPGYKPRKPKKVIEITAGEPTTVAGKKTGRRRELGMREVRLTRRERAYAPSHKKARAITRETKKTEITTPKAIKRIIRISDEIAVGELAKRMGVKGSEVIRKLMGMGMMVSINQALDYETASIVSTEFGFELENVAVEEEDFLHVEEDRAEDLVSRPPVVTIMGHVDHGKTSLLEAIRKVDMLSQEAGGITQHIGAYDVQLERGRVVFLDTPGHEAFTAMRARGAQVTDLVVLCVAADDGVMLQTKEAINHAKAANVPIIVAINKMDKADANPEKIKQSLTEFELVSEAWGGETLFSEVSAKKQTGIEHLLDQILLQTEMMELKANPDKRAQGVIVESKLEKGRGPVVTVLVKEGTLRIGDPMVSGNYYGKVRTMTDPKGRTIDEAPPSTPVEVVGLSGVPNAGDLFHVTEDEKTARNVAELRADKERAKDITKLAKVSLEDLYEKIQTGEAKELNIIIKADVQGSCEALSDALSRLSTDAVKVQILHTSVGGINETDVNLASASNALIVGFNVRPEANATPLAEREGVQIKTYSVIYDVLDDIRDAMVGLLEPEFREKELGRAEVRQTFSVSRIGTIAGCMVLEGKLIRNSRARLVRDSVVIYDGKLASLRRFKDDVKEVSAGTECGISLENYNDIKENDIIEVYEMEEVKPEL